MQATLLLCFVNTCGFIINKQQIPGGEAGTCYLTTVEQRSIACKWIEIECDSPA
jgi:hypothetical protein